MVQKFFFGNFYIMILKSFILWKTSNEVVNSRQWMKKGYVAILQELVDHKVTASDSADIGWDEL